MERRLMAEETSACVDQLKEEGMAVNYPDLELFKKATENLRQEETRDYQEDYERAELWIENCS